MIFYWIYFKCDPLPIHLLVHDTNELFLAIEKLIEEKGEFPEALIRDHHRD